MSNINTKHTLIKFKDGSEIIMLNFGFVKSDNIPSNKEWLEKMQIWEKVDSCVPIYHDVIFAKGGYPSMSNFQNITKWQLIKKLIKDIISLILLKK